MEPTRYAHVIRWVFETPWAILPSKLMAIQDALGFLAAGGEYSAAEIAAIVGARPRAAEKAPTGVAVLPLRGTIAHRAGMLSNASGGTSTEQFAAQFREFVADPEIGAIMVDVDSPGGTVTGVEELAAEIYRGRGRKPIVASVNPMAASAAYWIASAADEIALTPTGEVGSIGVFTAHRDMSKYYEDMGLKYTLVSAGKYKTEMNPYGPLSDEARAALQERIDDYYGMFTRAVARHRKMKAEDVRNGFGEGRMVGAKDALAMGMVDRVETPEDTLARLRETTRGTVVAPAANREEPARANLEEPRRGIALERVRLELARLRV